MIRVQYRTDSHLLVFLAELPNSEISSEQRQDRKSAWRQWSVAQRKSASNADVTQAMMMLWLLMWAQGRAGCVSECGKERLVCSPTDRFTALKSDLDWFFRLIERSCRSIISVFWNINVCRQFASRCQNAKIWVRHQLAVFFLQGWTWLARAKSNETAAAAAASADVKWHRKHLYNLLLYGHNNSPLHPALKELAGGPRPPNVAPKNISQSITEACLAQF